MKHNIYVYILIMFVVSYLIRSLPLTLVKKPIKSRFIKSFLNYVPYVTLALMTFPAIMSSTDASWIGLVVLGVGIVLAWIGFGLPIVACACSILCFVLECVL